MKRLMVLPVLMVVVLALAACMPVQPASAPAAEPMAEATAMPAGEDAAAMADIVDTAREAGSFTTLLAAVEAAGLVDALRGEGPFTVFAPTDNAFAQIPQETLDALLADPSGALTDILLYHVVPGQVMAADVADGLEVDTLLGAPVRFSVSNGTAMINDATIIATDVAASNGVIHVIDSVILPPADDAAAAESEPAAALADIVDTAVGSGSFPTLVAAVQAAGLVDVLKSEGPFTVFAPTEEAFAALPAGTIDALLADPQGQLAEILKYHVVPGKVMAADLADGLTVATAQGADVTFAVHGDGAAMINEANIVAADIEASNGVIHVIDAVILPPAEEAAEEAAAEEVAPSMDIVDTAVASGSFPTLVAAVQAAGLVDALKGEGPFTVFAPTEEAFAALPAGTLDSLLADPQGQLAEILKYHVIPGKVMAADIADGSEVATLQGATVHFMLHEGAPMINEANIVSTDIETSNGVIHVIDAVILPPAE